LLRHHLLLQALAQALFRALPVRLVQAPAHLAPVPAQLVPPVTLEAQVEAVPGALVLLQAEA